MKRIFFVLLLIITGTSATNAQVKKESIPLAENKNLMPVNVKMSEANYLGKKALKVIDIGENSEVKFVKINQSEFGNGIIEIEVSGKPSATAPELARGFVGIAFRINNDNTKFECLYLRPANGRADDQVRRNHSVQYISYPGFPWQKLRNEFPEKYESYVDLVPGEWTRMKIEVNGDKAKLFVHDNPQPTLIVNDLKHGPGNKGSIGLWIGPGTEAHFTNIMVTRVD